MNRIYRYICRRQIVAAHGITIDCFPIFPVLLLFALYLSPEIKATNNALAKNTVSTNNMEALNEAAYEDISVAMQIEGHGGGYSVDALYSSKNQLYVSVEDLFRNLHINCEILEGGELIRGFIDQENNRYTLNYAIQKLTVNRQSYNIYKTVIKLGEALYIDPALLSKAFGLHLSFNFRALTVTLKSEFELPLFKTQRIEQTHNRIIKAPEEIEPDTIFERRYHLLKPGMLDWSYSSSQAKGRTLDTRLGLGVGAELLGGEANVFLNYSDKYKFDNRMQQYLWRWVNNNFAPVRQIQVGKISSQSISSIYHPVVGAAISNSPTQVRKATGEYKITNYTQPGWVVELYINGALTDYTKADASGLYMFNIPLVYGFSTLTLKFYGPMGEERSEEQTLNVPYNFLPPGEFEYRVSGGILQDGQNTKFARGEGAMGINWGLTIGGGMEYLSSIETGKSIPFITVSALPFSRLILKGEYAQGVRTRGTLNFYLGKSTLLELDYIKYVEGQRAILYGYLEERKASLSLPLRYKSISGYNRLSFRQNVYKNLSYNMAEVLMSANYHQLNANISTYANWIDHYQPYLNANVALSYRTKRGLILRPSAQFNLTNRSLIMLKGEVEKRISRSGYLSVSYEKSHLANYNSVNVSFKYDLPFAQTQSSARLSNRTLYTSESAHGSVAFDNGSRYAKVNETSSVGRGGITLFPYLDANNNGRYDEGELKIKNLDVKISGGKIISREEDPFVRITGLEPFVYFTVGISDLNFDNIAWRVKHKKIKVLIDPNQFKQIEIPIVPTGEIIGQVNFQSETGIKGLGRILVVINRKTGENVTNILSESDGYVNHMGLTPGEYFAQVDSIQLDRLHYISQPARIDFQIKGLVDGDVVDNLNFTLSKDTLAKTPKKNKKALVKTPRVKLEDAVICGNLNEQGGNYFAQTMGFKIQDNAMALYKRLAFDKNHPIGVIRVDERYYVRLGYFKTKDEAYSVYSWIMGKGIRAILGNRLTTDAK